MTPALIVPDQSAWTMWGHEPAQLGLALAESPERARQLVVPDPVPAALAEAVRDAWSRMPAPRSYVAWPRAMDGVPAGELLGEEAGHGEEHGGDGEHGGDEEHGGHDMMAIVGDPSADGLVMEPIDFELGPLATGLPGGLVLGLSLDGDVVGRCAPRATLALSLGPIAGGAYGDPLAPVAWTTAIAKALEHAGERAPSEATTRLRIAAVEAERALSHMCWLRGFGYVLGWAQLSEQAHDGVVALMAPRLRLQEAAARLEPAGPDRDGLLAQVAAAAGAVERVRRLLDGSRRLRARTRGRAEVPAERIAATAVGGPVARAAGLPRDARAADPAYSALDFTAATLEAGDAEARTLLRAAEAVSALELVRTALAQEGSPDAGRPNAPAEAVVEGPRGPVRAWHEGGRLRVGAPGQAELLELAGEAVLGLEVGRALAGLASFDLSGWAVSA